MWFGWRLAPFLLRLPVASRTAAARHFISRSNRAWKRERERERERVGLSENGRGRCPEGGGGRGREGHRFNASDIIVALCTLLSLLPHCQCQALRSFARSHVPSRRSAVTTYHFTTSPLLSRAIWSPFARSLSGGRELLRDRSALLRALVWLLPSHPIPFPPSGVARSIWQSALGPTASWDNLQSRSAGGDTGDGEVKRRPQHRGITHNSGSGVRPVRGGRRM